jgi:hypothetical protein
MYDHSSRSVRGATNPVVPPTLNVNAAVNIVSDNAEPFHS